MKKRARFGASAPASNKKKKGGAQIAFRFEDEDISDEGGSETDEFGVPITRRRGRKKDDDGEGDEDDLSDRETAAEKRVRLAKAMLARYTQEERQSAAAVGSHGDDGGNGGNDDAGEDDEDDWKTEGDSSQRGITGERDDVAITKAVSQRLYDDVREAKGKLYRECAEVLLTCETSEVSSTFHRGHDKAPTCVCISHDERSAWTGSKDCSIVRWDVETGKRVSRYQGGPVTKTDRKRDGGKAIHACGHSDEVLAVACTTDGRYLASGGRDATIRLWDTRTDQLLDTFKGHRDIVSCLSFQDYSHTLFSGSHDRTVKIWNMTERMYVDTLFGHQAEVVDVSCLRKERAVSCGRDRTVRVWKVEEGSQLVCRAKPRNVSLDCVTMINDKTYFSGSENGSLSLWSMHKKKPTYVCKEAHSGKWITAVASLRSTDLVATGSSDGGLRLWKVDTDDHYMEEMAHLGVPGFINGLSFGPSGRVLVAAIGREHRLGRWERMPSSQAKDGLQIVRLPDFGMRAAGQNKAAVVAEQEDNSLEAARDRILPSYE